MQKLTQQELIFSCFNNANEQEKTINDKCNRIYKNIADPMLQGIMSDFMKIAAKHIDGIKQKKKILNIPSLVKTNMSLDTLDVLQDLVKEVEKLQIFYNEHIIMITNPDIREMLTQYRDEEMKIISMLQQRIEALESKQTEVNKIFSTREGL